MTMANHRARPPLEALPGPFGAPQKPSGIVPSAAINDLVHAQVAALLAASPAYYELPDDRREQMQRDLEKIAAYSAALVQDQWASAKRLGQVPMRHDKIVAKPAAATALAEKKSTPADEFSPRAAGAVAGITKDVLNAVSFPTFVADLIQGTFQAIVNASIQQMEAYGKLLSNVAKTVDQFMADNITDNNARDYLIQSHPEHFQVQTTDGAPRIRVREGSDDAAKPDFKSEYGLTENVDLDDEAAEKVLVPAARRRLAQNRHSLLSTMVLMGINRIVVTSGRIYAKMGFHIDAKDTGAASSASQFDFKHTSKVGAGGGLGSLFGGPSFSSTTSVAYVSSSKRDSTDEINVSTDLTGEVELKFKSDYFPMERFAKPEMMALIQGHTPNPQANVPVAGGPEGRSKSGTDTGGAR